MWKTRVLIIRLVVVIVAGVLLSAFVINALAAMTVYSEEEPNDTPATANTLIGRNGEITGTINPVSDVDYFLLDGINNQWGFITFLDTSASNASTDGKLTAYSSDGTTVLQEDSGSWEHGSVIAWQKFVDGAANHYLRVSEVENNDLIEPYSLRYYVIAVGEEDEIEPNDTLSSGTVSAKSMKGVLSSISDVDCFRFNGHVGEQFLFALNADFERDGSSTDFTLSVYNPSGELIASANDGGVGENEAIDNFTLNEDGVYAYCVGATGAFSSGDFYLVGPLRDEYSYWSNYSLDPQWLNPGPGGNTIVGAQLDFELKFINTDFLTIPGEIRMSSFFDDACLELIDAPGANYTSTTEVRWTMDDLAGGETFSTFFTTRAISTCAQKIHESVSMDYFHLGVGKDMEITVVQPTLYLPLIMR
jgi:hypothetical protein